MQEGEVVAAITGGGTGAAGATGAVVTLGGGTSAAAITSGLATVGSLVGGGMLAGIGVCAAAPLALGAAAVGLWRLFKA